MEQYLVHHGILGMKWGVRRYQNKDGTLTPAGVKRRAKLENKLQQLGGPSSRQSSSADDAPKPKTYKDMSTAELRDATGRLRAENEYRAEYAKANPPKEQSLAGKMVSKTVNKVLTESVPNAVSSAGQTMLNNMLNKYADKTLEKIFGKPTVSPYDAAKKNAEYYKNLYDVKRYQEKLKTGDKDKK